MARYVPIGNPVNKSEAEGIRRLRDELPDHFVVVGNFELAMPGRRNTFEFDAVVIGEYGIWAVEIKGWSGRIEGDIRRWKLDWGPVENPFIRNEIKAKALRHFLVVQLGDLPATFFCEALVFLPLDPEIAVDDPRRPKIVSGPRIWEYFDDGERIIEHGPGPMSDRNFRDLVLDTITPLARERAADVDVAGYEIDAELDHGELRPYREFVGRHRIVVSRARVRIKMFELDPLLSSNEQERAFRRVVRDMEVLTSLDDNSYIARSYELIQDRNDTMVFYLVGEWISDRTLEDVIDGGSDVDFKTAALHLLRALHYIHENGIIHRRLHPGVVYLSGNPESPVKIADFDFARVARLESISTDLNELKTQGYCAPELWKERRADYDHRVDIYSVGVILAELLLRRRIFPTIQDALRHNEVWEEVRGELPEEYRDVLDQFVTEDPDNRLVDLSLAMRVFEQD